MSDPNEVAVAAVTQVADALGVKVDPVLVARAAGMLVGVLAGKKWAEAEAAGLLRAAAVTDAASAEAAAKERNR